MTQNAIVEKAEAFCNKHKIDSYPVKIVEICESYGIKVYLENLPKEMSGFIVVQKDNFMHFNSNKVIVANVHDSPARRRFTIAHELAHFILHRSGNEELYAHRDVGQSGMLEVEANIFASNILMPRNLVQRALDDFEALWGKVPFEVKCELLAHHFGVSEVAASVRLNQLGISQGGQR